MKFKDAKASVFVDTNIYLHFQPFDQIKWSAVLSYKRICLYVPPIIITELNRYKYDNQSRRRKDRSQAVLKKFNSMVQNMIPGDFQLSLTANFSIVFLEYSGDVAHYDGLLQTDGDDQLIASILDFKKNNPNIVQDDVFLVTDDIGLILKCKSYGIQYITLPDNFRSPDEPTDEERKLSRLEQELSDYRNKEPKMGLVFCVNDEEKTETQILVDPSTDIDSKELDRLCELEEKEIAWKPRLSHKVDGQGGLSGNTDRALQASIRSFQNMYDAFYSDPMNRISEDEIIKYQVEVTDYIPRYRQYLQELYRWRNINRRIKKIEVLLYNRGSCPATDIVIHLKVSDGVVILQPSNIEKEPEKVKRPENPKSYFQKMVDIPISASSFLNISSDYLQRLTPEKKVHNSHFIQNNDTTIEWHLDKLQHRSQLNLSLILLLPEVTSNRSYNIGYVILSDELTNPIENILVLQIVLEK